MLLLLMGCDVETNHGPPATNYEQGLCIGSLNTFSLVNKTERVLNVIDEQRLDVMAVVDVYQGGPSANHQA